MADQEQRFVEQWRDNAYGCFSSGHKFCREVCPVMQVTRNENHTPTAFHASIVAMEQGLVERRGRRRRLRPLHAVRRLRAALPEHALHRRLLPPPHAHGRRREGDARADGRDRQRAARPGGSGTSGSRRTTTSRCSARRACSQEHVADWAIGLDIPIGGETILFVDCEAAFSRTSYTRAFAQLLQKGGVEFGLMREQWCCGGPAAEMGYVDLARKHADHNVADWRAVGAKRIIAPDPHDFIAFTEDYPKYYGDDYEFEIVLGVELVNELVQGRQDRADASRSSARSPTTTRAG